MNEKRFAVLGLGALAALSLSAAGLRRLPGVTVPEGASIDVKTDVATSLRCSNTAVASALPPEGGHATVTGVKIGCVDVTLVDVRGPFATLPVTVVPPYWQTLQEFFVDDPEVSVSVSGDKVVVSGSTANPETLRRVEQSKAFDPARIVSQVTYSTPSIASLLGTYLRHVGYSNVTVTAVGNEICLAGRLFDKQAIANVHGRSKDFLKDFPGVGLNVDALQIARQKIILDVEMLEYDVSKARNLGVQTPTAVTAEFSGGLDYSYSSGGAVGGAVGGADATGGGTGTGTGGTGTGTGAAATAGGTGRGDSWSSRAGMSVSGVKATINLLKQNGAAKTVYKTSLATQSGEEVQFQNGGTIHRNTTGTFSSGDLKTIEYGFIVKAMPIIVDTALVNLDLDLDNKMPINYTPGEEGANQDITISRYQTKSKYMVRPGETIVMSGFNKVTESVSKSGTPLLSHIPLIGPWLFGNRNTSETSNEMLLVVTINWAVEGGSAEAIRRRDALREKSVDVEMP